LSTRGAPAELNDIGENPHMSRKKRASCGAPGSFIAFNFRASNFHNHSVQSEKGDLWFEIAFLQLGYFEG
jgi:hypothetical protein